MRGDAARVVDINADASYRCRAGTAASRCCALVAPEHPSADPSRAESRQRWLMNRHSDVRLEPWQVVGVGDLGRQRASAPVDELIEHRIQPDRCLCGSFERSRAGFGILRLAAADSQHRGGSSGRARPATRPTLEARSAAWTDRWGPNVGPSAMRLRGAKVSLGLAVLTVCRTPMRMARSSTIRSRQVAHAAV